MAFVLYLLLLCITQWATKTRFILVPFMSLLPQFVKGEPLTSHVLSYCKLQNVVRQGGMWH